MVLRSPSVLATTCCIGVVNGFSLICSFWHVGADLGWHWNVAVARVDIAPLLSAPSVAFARISTLLAAWVETVIPGLTRASHLQRIVHCFFVSQVRNSGASNIFKTNTGASQAAITRCGGARAKCHSGAACERGGYRSCHHQENQGLHGYSIASCF